MMIRNSPPTRTAVLLGVGLFFCFGLLVGCSVESPPASPERLVAEPSRTVEEPSLWGHLFSWTGSEKAQKPKPSAPNAKPEKKLVAAPDKRWNFFGWFSSLFEPDGNFSLSPADGEKNPSKEQAQRLKVKRFIQKKLASTNTIYVQSFTGEHLTEVRKGLFAAFKKQGRLKIAEILPDNIKNMAVLRIQVDDYTIWDQEESFAHQDLGQYVDSVKALVPEKIIRRNALVGVQLSLFDAETGLPLVRGEYSQPFQQIYAGKAIETMPRPNAEMQRLTQILISKILHALDSKTSSPFGSMELERGTSWGWFAEHVHDPGNGRIVKGIKLAKSGELDQAISLWKLVLFAPEPNEPKPIYRTNLASAFYDLGVVYQVQGDHLFAAKMFSQANRLKQTLRYAQAWGDNMHTWIDEKTKRVSKVDLDIEIPDLNPKVKKPKKKQPDVILLLETNPNLLLDAQQLWPLEPMIKNAKPAELNGTQRSKLDQPPTRFDRKGYIDYGSAGQESYPLPERAKTTKPTPSPAQPSSGFILPVE